MKKKIVSILTLTIFVLFNLGCVKYTYEVSKEEIGTVVGWDKWEKDKTREVVVLEVIKKSGERIEFFEGDPGRIVDDNIVGVVQQRAATVLIPLAEVASVWVRVKRVDRGRSLFTTLGGIGLAFGGVFTLNLFINPPDSCPLIYSFDGKNYILDAEPYGGAICRGLGRTEWCGLEYLKEDRGEYRLLVINELQETQYCDELKLLVVDHPVDVQAVAGAWDAIHTVKNPLPPARAYDRSGLDLRSYVRQNDRRLWYSRDDGRNPEAAAELREELIFEFPKPAEVRSAKLVFNGCNTLWGSRTIKRYLELYGNQVGAWYEEVDHMGPCLFKLLNMHLREELYSLQIRVETPEGWTSKGLIVGGGPLVSETKAYPLDLADVVGDTLRIKLTPPAAFWKINYLAVDYSEDEPVQSVELEAVEAVDHRGEEVGERLAQTDGCYLEMSEIGDSAELVFNAPPRNPTAARTLILKASGYYDIHLGAQGEPNQEFLERIHSEPGFAVKHAFQEYLKWKREVLEAIK